MSLDPDKLRAARLSKHWTQRQLAEREESWLQTYFEGLDVRVWRKEGVFHALNCVFQGATSIIPTWFLRHLG